MGIAMKVKGAVVSVAALGLSASAAFAQDYSGWRYWWWHYFGGGQTGGGSTGGSNAVPEIDAGAGLLAVAAVLATLALVWELRRRRKRS